ncbi:MAG: substrate-binding domain-containing protein, partial [Cyanobacteria bacterium J06641_5]
MTYANQLYYAKYSCVEGFPLSCKNTRGAGSETCHICGFPARLTPPIRLRADRGGYEVEVQEFLKIRGSGPIYRAVKVSDRQPVILKEYLLPARYFSQGEAKARQDRFRQLATFNLADGRPLKCRLPIPDDICTQASDPNEPVTGSRGRCYQIFVGDRLAYPSLREYLGQQGAIAPARVCWLLAQVLQSLTCLHGQKFRFRSGAVCHGIVHGNLTLDTLLLDSLDNPSLVYLSDLALWEAVFDPQVPWEEQAKLGTQVAATKDLQDLGEVALALLSGAEAGDRETDSNPERPSQPQLDEFIDRLLGKRLPAFASAEAAAQALPNIPHGPTQGSAIAAAPKPVEPTTKNKLDPKFVIAIVAAILALLLGAWLGVWLWWRGRAASAIAAEPETCCFDRVDPLPSQAFYLGAADGAWDFSFRSGDLVAPNQSLQALMSDERETLSAWCYQPHRTALGEIAGTTPFASTQACRAYARVGAEFAGRSIVELTRSGAIDFAVLNSDAVEFDAAYEVLPFARDSLVVFVAFNYQSREDGLTQKLNGTLSLQQLRQLYTGKVDRWRQLDARLPDLPVKLYAPQDEAAIAVFETRILQDPEAIAAFRALLAKVKNPSNPVQPSILQPGGRSAAGLAIEQLPTTQLLRQTIADFEDRSPPIGSIGFDSLARTFNQCSIYPLALRDERGPVSPLVTNDGKAISPRTDLCRDKGNYRPNYKAIASQQYPLSYPLAVVYRRDNRRPEAG